MENFTMWSCDKESSIFIMSPALQRPNIDYDFLVKKVVCNLCLPIKALKTCLQPITALSSCIFV